MTEELLPCPFCGSKDVYRDDEVKSVIAVIRCDDCGACNFVNEWNTRAPDPRLAEALEALREIVAEEKMLSPSWPHMVAIARAVLAKHEGEKS